MGVGTGKSFQRTGPLSGTDDNITSVLGKALGADFTTFYGTEYAFDSLIVMLSQNVQMFEGNLLAKKKRINENHVEVAHHLEFLSRSPVYRNRSIIVWVTGGAHTIAAANDLCDRGFFGVETEQIGLTPQITISMSRDRIPELLDYVSDFVAA